MEIFGVHICQDEVRNLVFLLPLVEASWTWLSLRSLRVYQLLRLFV